MGYCDVVRKGPVTENEEQKGNTEPKFSRREHCEIASQIFIHCWSREGGVNTTEEAPIFYKHKLSSLKVGHQENQPFFHSRFFTVNFQLFSILRKRSEKNQTLLRKILSVECRESGVLRRNVRRRNVVLASSSLIPVRAISS